MKKILFALLLLSLNLVVNGRLSDGGQGATTDRTTFKILSNNGNYVEIPFEVYDNFTLVKVKFNGAVGKWILDTDWIFEDGNIFEDLINNIPGKQKCFTDINTNVCSKVVNAGSVSIVNSKGDEVAVVNNFKAAAVSFDDLLFPAQKGTLGANALKGKVVKLDYGCNNTMTIYDTQYFKQNKSSILKGFNLVNTKFNLNRFLAKTKVNGVSIGYMIVDTGSDSVFLSYSSGNTLSSRLGPVNSFSQIGYGNTYIKTNVYENVKVELGGIKQAVELSVPSEPIQSIKGAAGDLGYPALQDLVLILDYPSKKLYVKKSEKSASSCSSGIFTTATIAEIASSLAVMTAIAIGFRYFYNKAKVKDMLEKLIKDYKGVGIDIEKDPDYVNFDNYSRRYIKAKKSGEADVRKFMNEPIYKEIFEPVLKKYGLSLTSETRESLLASEAPFSEFHQRVSEALAKKLSISTSDIEGLRLSEKSPGEWLLKVDTSSSSKLGFNKDGIIEPEKLSSGLSGLGLPPESLSSLAEFYKEPVLSALTEKGINFGSLNSRDNFFTYTKPGSDTIQFAQATDKGLIDYPRSSLPSSILDNLDDLPSLSLTDDMMSDFDSSFVHDIAAA